MSKQLKMRTVVHMTTAALTIALMIVVTTQATRAQAVRQGSAVTTDAKRAIGDQITLTATITTVDVSNTATMTRTARKIGELNCGSSVGTLALDEHTGTLTMYHHLNLHELTRRQVEGVKARFERRAQMYEVMFASPKPPKVIN